MRYYPRIQQHTIHAISASRIWCAFGKAVEGLFSRRLFQQRQNSYFTHFPFSIIGRSVQKGPEYRIPTILEALVYIYIWRGPLLVPIKTAYQDTLSCR